MAGPVSLVGDCNVWIDLDVGGLLDHAFRLPFGWLAPDVVVAELTRDTPSGKRLVQLGLDVRELPGELTARVAELRQSYLRPSTPDLFALALAEALGIALITGDASLREAAEQEGVEVHGALWVLDEMVARGVAAPTEAADALQAMLDNGRRLPLRESTARIARWRAST